MSLTASSTPKERLPIIPADVYQAVCYGLIDLGTHYDKRWDKSTHKCIILWELPDVRMEYTKDGKTIDAPRVISKNYTLSLGEKSNLRKDLQSWRGKPFGEQELLGFDLKNVLGSNCMIQIIHVSNEVGTFANVSSILPLYKGIPSKTPENPILFFSFEEGFDIPAGVPEWIAKMIKESEEIKGASVGSSDKSQKNEDDIPF